MLSILDMMIEIKIELPDKSIAEYQEQIKLVAFFGHFVFLRPPMQGRNYKIQILKVLQPVEAIMLSLSP